MREIKPHETRSGLRGVAHEMVVIGPNDGDEKITDRITEPCRPEGQERFKGGELRRAQLQNQHRYEDSEHAVGERAQTFRGPSHVWHGRPPPSTVRPTSPRRHPCEASCRSSTVDTTNATLRLPDG